MLKKIVIFSTLALFLSACVTGPDGYFKRSANNKLIDSKGFKRGKRSPLYNKKYIAQAKKNVITDEYEYDDFDNFDEDSFEAGNPSKDNIQMYKAMIDRDLSEERRYNRESRFRSNYPSIRRANHRVDDNYDAQDMELREELNQIKAMLHDTKREMANTRCPSAAQIEKAEAAKSRKHNVRKEPVRYTKPAVIEPIESL